MPTPLEEVRSEFLAFRSDVQALATRWVSLMDKIEAALTLDSSISSVIPKQGGAMVPPARHLCPLCNAPMKLRTGYRGEFYGCTNYPECEGTRNIDGRNSSKPGCKRLAPVKATPQVPVPDTALADKQLDEFGDVDEDGPPF